jgi:hypothetical protein
MKAPKLKVHVDFGDVDLDVDIRIPKHIGDINVDTKKPLR